ncbi:MAG: aldo/keto reductase [Actinobacteria bacterium]|nr:MAG: aldo/keto reductase [Actinomycetota bacterium]TMK93680.1 MAG: aldo/keto reductase [Actinomycetota bacterium]
MLRRPLGETGLAASRIGLGLAALGRPVYIDVGRECDLGKERTRTTMEARCREVLDAAYAAGIRYLDVARSYGDAEAFLGAWLEVRDPPDVLVGSKWGYTYVGGWRVDADVQEVKDLSVDALRRQIAESRRLLGDRLSLYQIHSATIESGVFDDHEVLEELRSLRESGLFLGFSTSGPKQAEAIARGIQERVDGEPLFSTVQSTWNVLEPSAGPALAEAHAEGRGVLIKEAMANGRLAAPEGPLVRIAGRLGTTPDRVALAAALAHPWVDVVLSGAVTVDQVRSNAVAVDLTLPADALSEMDAFAQPPERYWTDRAALPWR